MMDQIVLVPYDPDWPRRFEEERRALADVFSGIDAAIEHVGSTAVPGLGSKPVIDVMVGASTLAAIESRIAALEAGGYEYVRSYEQQLPDRRYFRKPQSGPRSFHLHAVVIGSEFWIRHLQFRDFLRTHPDVAGAYYSLKADLARRVSKAEYTAAKSPFIEEVLARCSATRDSWAGSG
jgi:GrpB-like predicted nucleotidyltransferase (UPF0157 family)